MVFSILRTPFLFTNSMEIKLKRKKEHKWHFIESTQTLNIKQ